MSTLNPDPHKQGDPTMNRPTIQQRLTSITNTINAMERKIAQFRAEGRLEDAEFFGVHLAELQALRARELHSVQDFIPRQSPFAAVSSSSKVGENQLGGFAQGHDSFSTPLKNVEGPRPQLQPHHLEQQRELGIDPFTSPQSQQFWPTMSYMDTNREQVQQREMIGTPTRASPGVSYSDGQEQGFNQAARQAFSPQGEACSTSSGGENPMRQLSVPEQMRKQLEMRLREVEDVQGKDMENILHSTQFRNRSLDKTRRGTEFKGPGEFHANTRAELTLYQPILDFNPAEHNNMARIQSAYPGQLPNPYQSSDHLTGPPKEEANEESIWDVIDKKRKYSMGSSQQQPKHHEKYEEKASRVQISTVLNSYPAWCAAQSPTAPSTITAGTSSASEGVASTPPSYQGLEFVTGPTLRSTETTSYSGGAQTSKNPGIIGEGHGNKHIKDHEGISAIHPFNRVHDSRASHQNPFGVIGQNRGRDDAPGLDVKMERLALAKSTKIRCVPRETDEAERPPVRSLAFMKLESDTLDGVVEELGEGYRPGYEQQGLIGQVLEEETDLSL